MPGTKRRVIKKLRNVWHHWKRVCMS